MFAKQTKTGVSIESVSRRGLSFACNGKEERLLGDSFLNLEKKILFLLSHECFLRDTGPKLNSGDNCVAVAKLSSIIGPLPPLGRLGARLSGI